MGYKRESQVILSNPKMDEERLLNIKEAAHFLGKSEKEIKDLLKIGKLDAYQIGGMYLRFKLGQLQNFKNSLDASVPSKKRPTKERHIQYRQLSFIDNVNDFFYFNDFYILAVLVIIALLLIILRNIS